jgi:hypothetical protein
MLLALFNELQHSSNNVRATKSALCLKQAAGTEHENKNNK